jgi:LysM repeat protein
MGNSGVKTEADSHHGRLGWMRLTGENILPEICFVSSKSDMDSYQKNKFLLAKDIADVLIEFASDKVNIPTVSKTHTVVSGDTLSKIATKYATTVSNIKTLNDLKSDNIKISQVLKV